MSKCPWASVWRDREVKLPDEPFCKQAQSRLLGCEHFGKRGVELRDVAARVLPWSPRGWQLKHRRQTHAATDGVDGDGIDGINFMSQNREQYDTARSR